MFRFVIYFLFTLGWVNLFSQTLTLEQCKELALQNNHRLRMHKYRIEQSQWLRKAAFTQYLFSLDASATYLRLNKQFRLLENDVLLPVIPSAFYDPQTGQVNTSLFTRPDLWSQVFVTDPQTGMPVTDVNGNPVFLQYAWLPSDELVFGQKNNYLLQWTLRQPIYLGGKIRQLNIIASTTEKMANIQYDAQAEDLMLEVENLYWDLIVLIERKKLVQTYEKLLMVMLDNVSSYVDEGIVLDNMLTKVQMQQQEVEINKLKIENGIQLLRKALCQKIGLPLEQYFEPADTVVPVPSLDQDLQDVLSLSNAHRYELQLLEQSLLLSKSLEKMMISRFLPQVSVVGTYQFLRPNPYDGMSDNFGGDYMVGLSVQVPIFHWQERYYTYRAARAQYEISRVQLEEARQLIMLQTEQQFNDVKEKWLEMERRGQSVQLAERNLRIMQDKWEVGMCKLSDLLEAEVMWYEANSQYIEAKASYRKALIELKKSSGTLMQ